jgi:DNA-binding PadR family transcriptional regulator
MSLQHVLLALLSKQPNTGYGVGRLLRDELSHLWDARLQQIYGELGKLEARGLLVVETVALSNRPAKKIYSLTAAGYETLDEWLITRPRPRACRDDFLIRLICLERLSPDFLARRLEERLDEMTREEARLSALAAQISRTDPDQLGRLLALDAALARAQAEAAWCGRAATILRGGVAEVALAADSPQRATGASDAVA